MHMDILGKSLDGRMHMCCVSRLAGGMEISRDTVYELHLKDGLGGGVNSLSG